MSSTVRSYATPVRLATEFHRIETPCFYDGSNNVPFPFSYNNGTLDIENKYNFNAQMIDNTGNEPNTDIDGSVRLMGGNRLVQKLGDNFKAYIRAWRNVTIDVNSPISVYEPSQVVRVQEAGTDNIRADSGDSYIVSTSAPVSDNFISGMEDNNYNSTYIFKTPLTITIKEGGVLTYLTFRTIMDQE
jgi:hypothetical protein